MEVFVKVCNSELVVAAVVVVLTPVLRFVVKVTVDLVFPVLPVMV